MHRPPIFAWALALALSSAHAAAAESQPTTPQGLAQQRFKEANQAYQEGRYSAAASLFDAADRLAPHPSTRFNAAAAWEQAGEAARAATGYEAVLAVSTLDEGRRKVAEARLASLKQTLARVKIRKPLGAMLTVDHVQRASVPTAFYLRPGAYDLQVEYQGETTTRHAEVFAGKEHDLKLNLPDSEPPPPSLPSVPLKPAPLPPPIDEDGGTQKTWGWVSVGAGVALSGAAMVLGLRALAARDRFVASGNTNPDARGEAADLRLATNVLWGGATAAGATGLFLLLTAPTVEF